MTSHLSQGGGGGFWRGYVTGPEFMEKTPLELKSSSYPILKNVQKKYT